MVAPRIVCVNCRKIIPRTYTVCPFCSKNPRELQRPVWEQYKFAERGVPWYLLARRTFLFNDGWGESRAELEDPAPGLLHVTLQRIQRFDDDPSGLPRVVAEFALGPSQALALLEFLAKHKDDLEREAKDEPNTWSSDYEPSNMPEG